MFCSPLLCSQNPSRMHYDSSACCQTADCHGWKWTLKGSEVPNPVSKSVGGRVWRRRRPSARLLTSKKPLLHQGRSDRGRAPSMSGNGEECPLISDLQRDAFKYRLALPHLLRGGKYSQHFRRVSGTPPFCHVKNPIERNLTNPWGLPRGPERFSLCVQQAWLQKCLRPGNGIYALKQLYMHVKTHVYMFLFHFMKTSSMFSFNRNQQEK